MKQKIVLTITFVVACLFVPQLLHAISDGDCGCAYTLPLNVWKVDGDALNIQPGDVICLEAGTRNRMRLENLHGTAENPIIIKNCGGQLTTTESDYGIKVAHSSFVHLTGTGDPNVEYGIRAGGTVFIGELTTNIEVDHLEVYSADFAGFMIKTDPSCNPATWRENYTMRDVSIHDNYVHNTDRGEGFYIGFTFFSGYDVECDDETINVLGHVIENLEVYDNITEDTAADGIQVGSAPNASVHDNTIRLFGQRPFASNQNNGMKIGAGTTGVVYNNWIEDGAGNGLAVLATGELTVYNNLIKDANLNGIFCDERSTPSAVAGFSFINNTILNSTKDGIRIYADDVPMNHIKNNIIGNVGEKYMTKLSGVVLEMENNLLVENLTEVKFRDVAGGDFHLLPDSPAVDTGMNVDSFNISADRSGTIRPFGTAYEIGAFEFDFADQHIYLPAILK